MSGAVLFLRRRQFSHRIATSTSPDEGSRLGPLFIACERWGRRPWPGKIKTIAMPSNVSIGCSSKRTSRWIQLSLWSPNGHDNRRRSFLAGRAGWCPWSARSLARIVGKSLPFDIWGAQQKTVNLAPAVSTRRATAVLPRRGGLRCGWPHF